MTSITSALRSLAARIAPAERAELPDTDFAFAPANAGEAATLLSAASEHGVAVRYWGGGTHQDLGRVPDAPVIVSTERLAGVVDWQVEDLTVVVGAGTQVADLELMLATSRQTAVLPEAPGVATVGGVVASGVSGFRRLRYGPTRDRVLQVELVTGDGRIVTAGGRVVKNVTGYDLPRLATGSLGRLGLVTQVCLKLWPRRDAEATVVVESPEAAADAYRPLAVLETPESTTVSLTGTAAEVEAQAAALGGATADGLTWPALPDPDDDHDVVSVRVPARELASARDLVRDRFADARFVAAHRVGELLVAVPNDAVEAVTQVRRTIEERQGAVVIVAGRGLVERGLDPWGTPPATLELQRRVIAAFDPAGVSNPGRLPGGL